MPTDFWDRVAREVAKLCLDKENDADVGRVRLDASSWSKQTAEAFAKSFDGKDPTRSLQQFLFVIPGDTFGSQTYRVIAATREEAERIYAEEYVGAQ